MWDLKNVDYAAKTMTVKYNGGKIYIKGYYGKSTNVAKAYKMQLVLQCEKLCINLGIKRGKVVRIILGC